MGLGHVRRKKERDFIVEYILLCDYHNKAVSPLLSSACKLYTLALHLEKRSVYVLRRGLDGSARHRADVTIGESAPRYSPPLSARSVPDFKLQILASLH